MRMLHEHRHFYTHQSAKVSAGYFLAASRACHPLALLETKQLCSLGGALRKNTQHFKNAITKVKRV